MREVFQTSWSAAYPSGGAFLEPLFQSGSRSNVAGFKVPDVDGHILEAQTTDDDASRALRFGDVEAEIIGWMPVIPLATFPINSVEQAKVRGIAPLPTGNFDITRAWLT